MLDTIGSCTLSAFGCVFIICEMGQRISYAFDEIGEMIWDMKWYLHSNKIQKLLPIIINAVQKPVAIKFFGSVTCSRESLKKV